MSTSICAEDDDGAERLAGSIRLWRACGLGGPIPSPDEVSAWETATGRRLPVQVGRVPPIVGSPQRCRADLLALAAHHGVDEVMVVTIVWDHAARVRSYELLADALELAPAPTGVGGAAPADGQAAGRP